MLKTEILLYNELTKLMYSKTVYCTVLVRKRNNSCVAPLATLVPQNPHSLLIAYIPQLHSNLLLS